MVLALTVPALALDAVDGRVARRTGTVTAFGCRFDGEVDAFLILVLSVAAAPTVGWWVLAAGLARYAFAVAGWWLPWMRATLEFRYWRKVVTATVGIVLAVAVADVLPAGLTTAVVLVGLALLAESFGRDVWWLWRHRAPAPATTRTAGVGRRGLAVCATVLAVALVWFALVAPTRPDRLTPGAFLRLPVEAVALAAVALVVSARSARAVTVVVGTLLGVVTLLKVLDLGAFTVLDRPVQRRHRPQPARLGVRLRARLARPVGGRGAAPSRRSPWSAPPWCCLPWAVGRLARAVSRHRARSARVRRGGRRRLGGLLALSGLQVSPGGPVAAADTGPFVAGKVRGRDGGLPGREDLRPGPRGRRLPRPGIRPTCPGWRARTSSSPSSRATAASPSRGPNRRACERCWTAGRDRLQRLGYTASSGWLSSPTFGGSSWLAHSTLQSGLTVGDQGRYDQLLSSPRTTLTSAFGRAGWRTVAVLPSTRGTWPEGRTSTGSTRSTAGRPWATPGRRFGFSAMPDQFTLAALDRLELAAAHAHAGHGGGRAHLEPRAVGAAADDGRPVGARRRVGLRRIEADAVTAPQLWSDRADVPAPTGRRSPTR